MTQSIYSDIFELKELYHTDAAVAFNFILKSYTPIFAVRTFFYIVGYGSKLYSLDGSKLIFQL
jgi:hypothetical protein